MKKKKKNEIFCITQIIYTAYTCSIGILLKPIYNKNKNNKTNENNGKIKI